MFTPKDAAVRVESFLTVRVSTIVLLVNSEEKIGHFCFFLQLLFLSILFVTSGRAQIVSCFFRKFKFLFIELLSPLRLVCNFFRTPRINSS